MSGLFGGGTQKTTSRVEIDPELREESRQLLDIGRLVASLGYQAPQGPTVAAFTPAQEAAFGNTNDAAAAFGMQTSPNPLAGVQRETSANGVEGYSGYDNYMQERENLPPEFAQQMAEIFNLIKSGGQPVEEEKPSELSEYGRQTHRELNSHMYDSNAFFGGFGSSRRTDK